MKRQDATDMARSRLSSERFTHGNQKTRGNADGASLLYPVVD